MSWQGPLSLARHALDLLVPESCPGCGRPGSLCRECKMELARLPQRVSPRAGGRAPVWACGNYSGAVRELILAAKERDSGMARQLVGEVLGAAIRHFIAAGEIMPPQITPIVLIPAPTRLSSRLRRGGDPMSAACAQIAATLPRTSVEKLVRTSQRAVDSAGLSAAGRRENLSGRIVPTLPVGSQKHQDLRLRCAQATVVLVDDIVTTGATIAETELVAASLGIRLDLVLVLARA